MLKEQIMEEVKVYDDTDDIMLDLGPDFDFHRGETPNLPLFNYFEGKVKKIYQEGDKNNPRKYWGAYRVESKLERSTDSDAGTTLYISRVH